MTDAGCRANVLPATLPAAVREAAAAYREVDAVVEGNRRLSYGELAQQARRAGAAFVAAGVRPGDAVAIWAPNGTDWIVAFLGLSWVGAMLVPINTRFQGAEAAEVLRRSRARLLVSAGNFLGRDFPAMLTGFDLPHLEGHLTFDSDWEGFLSGGDDPDALAEADRRAAAVSPGDYIDLIFTSGTTGHPKGVRCTHGATLRSYRYYAANLGIGRADRYLLVNPLFHSFGEKAGVVAAVVSGATLYPMSVYDPSVAAELIAKEAITVFPGPPTVYHGLLEVHEKLKDGLTSLRLAVTGAATVPVELLRRMKDELGFDVVLTAYGLTETAGLVTMCRAGDPLELVSRTCGRAIPGVEVALSDAGEVLVRGYPVLDGYFEDPEATAQAIDEEGWLHTGDVGELDEDGYLRITDRLKDMFIVGGFNVYPAEVEATLLEAPGVAQVAVVGVPDERLGEVGVAFVVPRTGECLDSATLQEFARGRLANYKVPRRFNVVAELPLNASGKVQKDVLRERAQ